MLTGLGCTQVLPQPLVIRPLQTFEPYEVCCQAAPPAPTGWASR